MDVYRILLLPENRLHGASDVWAGAGFHQANAHDGEITQFENFTVWPLDTAQIAAAPATPTALATPVSPATPIAQATPSMPMATPVAGAVANQEIALRLGQRDESRIDALAVLTEREGQTTINVVARDASGGEVAVVQEGT